MYLIISLCCVNLVLVMPTPSVAVSPSVRVPSQDAGRNTSGKMVTWQQNWFDLGGAGELHLGLDQLGEAGSFGIAMPSLQKQSKFPSNQNGPLLALIYFYVPIISYLIVFVI